ncbi:hypothetical protein M885DRAFT_525963 [Pelagophyceae sp. CCMP2097]|nr:hypothetical protein M885DRAFT_525963 [Pelagophyceae sp. CCMP2097]
MSDAAALPKSKAVAAMPKPTGAKAGAKGAKAGKTKWKKPTGGKATGKAQRGKTKAVDAAANAATNAEIASLLKALSACAGTLSDALNPDHAAFSADFQGRFKSAPKKVRAAVVAADRAKVDAKNAIGANNLAALPFPSECDDHCESPPEAYADIASVLDLVATALGKTRATLLIYDPYFCAGAMKQHLSGLGFTSVRNDAVDFYHAVENGEVPSYDVLVTNPPYSADHVQRLLAFTAQSNKPFLLLVPNYVAGRFPDLAPVKPLRGRRTKPVYVCPLKRYCYWTPKSMRPRGNQQGHVSALGHRTSPFASFWCVDLEPTVSRSAIIALDGAGNTAAGTATARASIRPPPRICGSLNDLPPAVRP